jgi:hypothetical protein
MSKTLCTASLFVAFVAVDGAIAGIALWLLDPYLADWRTWRQPPLWVGVTGMLISLTCALTGALLAARAVCAGLRARYSGDVKVS